MAARAVGLRVVTRAARAGAIVLALAAGPSHANRIYVTNEDSNDVTVIDADAEEVVATIPVGKRPRGLRLSPDRRTLYVALSGSPKAGPGVDASKLPPANRAADGIGVVDLTTGRLVRVLASGQDPETFDLSSDGRTIFVSNEETSELSFVDVENGRVTGRVRVGGEPEGVTVSPDGMFVYVTSEEDNEVAVIDVKGRTRVGTIAVGPRPRAIIFAANGKTAFVTCELGAQVSVIDAERHRVRTSIPLEAPLARPMGAVLSADGTTLYVSNGRGSTVSIIDVARGKSIGFIADVGRRPWGIGVSSDGRKLYTANGPSDDVSVIDLERRVVVKRIKAGESPWGLVVSD